VPRSTRSLLAPTRPWRAHQRVPSRLLTNNGRHLIAPTYQPDPSATEAAQVLSPEVWSGPLLAVPHQCGFKRLLETLKLGSLVEPACQLTLVLVFRLPRWQPRPPGRLFKLTAYVPRSQRTRP
jgi:hypothetical protein